MNLLSIGNSFSQDAQRYLHRIARADGVDLQTCNLYIGGCPLSAHYRNMLSEQRTYTLEVNGNNTGFPISLKEALLNRNWDVITVQQVSHQAPYYETYQPYLEKLVEYVRALVPKAKVVVHQTWAYEQNCNRLCRELGYTDRKAMTSDIVRANAAAVRDIHADGLLPSGELFDAMVDGGVEKIHRDTFHASLGLGRYALGLLWYRFLTGRDVSNNPFADFDEEVTSEEIALAKQCVAELAAKYGK